jgi:Matrixin
VNDDGAPLTASTAPTVAGETAALTPERLGAVVGQATAGWLAVRPGADFGGLTVSIGELEGLLLGVTAERTITVDATAAGWGWTVSGGSLDLLTVVEHELGHALGLDHEESGVMAPTLAAGEIRSVAATSPSRSVVAIPSLGIGRLPQRSQPFAAIAAPQQAWIALVHPLLIDCGSAIELLPASVLPPLRRRT